MAVDEKRIEFLMKKLGCSREEALDLEGYDADVSKGKATAHDLTPEQQANVKKMMRQVDHAKPQNPVKRERKPNELKEAIIAELAEFLKEDAQGQVYEDVEITNISRMIAFQVGEKRFELTLIEKRPPKK